MEYKIVADSSANIHKKSGLNFASVPLKIVTSEKEFSDKKGTDVKEMVTYLQGYKGKSSTSCPNVQEWLDAFGDAKLILGVTITSNLSGSYSSAMQAKTEYEEMNPDAKVLIVDSLSAGPELELIIEKMEELVNSEQSFDDITSIITEYCKHTHLLFALKHLDNLARNGRVNPAMAKIAGLLGIRVVGKASDEGTLEQLHKCRGGIKSVECIWDEMVKHGYCGGKVRLAHCFNPKMAEDLSDKIHQNYPDADVHIRRCTALCSYYAELGGLMIGFEG